MKKIPIQKTTYIFDQADQMRRTLKLSENEIKPKVDHARLSLILSLTTDLPNTLIHRYDGKHRYSTMLENTNSAGK